LDPGDDVGCFITGIISIAYVVLYVEVLSPLMTGVVRTWWQWLIGHFGG
jgi:hypothetical protein